MGERIAADLELIRALVGDVASTLAVRYWARGWAERLERALRGLPS